VKRAGNEQRIVEHLKNKGMIAAFFAAVLLCWELVAAQKIVNPFYISQPTQIGGDLIRFIFGGEAFKHMGITLQESFSGLVLGTAAGVIVGFVLGRVDFLARIFEPTITALYGIPKLALAPIFILWFGLGIESKIFLSGLLVFYLVFFSTFGGIRNVDPNIVGAIRMMGASDFQIMRMVTLPSCIPWIMTGIRGGLGASLLGAIVGEYMGASAGLGWMIQYATTTYQIDRVMSCIFILLVTGLVLNKALNLLEKHLLRWRPSVG
jgi:NitT/TauT family transport system permease protein